MAQNEYFIELRPDPTRQVLHDGVYVVRGTGEPVELFGETSPVAPTASGVFAFYTNLIQAEDKPVTGAETRRAAGAQNTTTQENVCFQELALASSPGHFCKPDALTTFSPTPRFIGSKLSPIFPAEQQSWEWNVEMLNVSSQVEALANPMAFWIYEDAGDGLFRLRPPLDNGGADTLYLCASTSPVTPQKMIILPSSQVPPNSSYFKLNPVQGTSGSRL